MLAGHAARFRADRVVTDYLHVIDDCTLLCNSYEFAFSAGWCSPGARLCGDAFRRGWATPGTPRERFEHAAATLLEELRANATRLWQDDDFGPGGSAIATFLAVLATGDGALHVQWLGDELAILVRDRAPIAATVPHTLGSELAKQGHDVFGQRAASILVRTVSTDAAHVPEHVTWERRPGDHLVIASGELALCARVGELAALVDPARSPTELAERMVALAYDRAGSGTEPFGAIAAVTAY